MATEKEPQEPANPSAFEPPQGADTVNIPAEAPEADDGGDDTQPGTPSGQAQRGQNGRFATDRGNRRGRMSALQRENEGLKTQLSGFNTTLQRMEASFSAQLAAIRGGGQQAPAQGGQQAVDPYETKISDIDKAIADQSRLHRAHDPEKGDFDFTRWNQLNREKNELIARATYEKVAKEQAEKQRQTQQPQHPADTPFGQQRIAALMQDFSWIRDARLAQEVGARYNLLRLNSADSLQLHQQACIETAAAHPELNLSVPQARGTPRQQRLAGGYPQGDNGGGGNGGQREYQVPRALLAGLNLPEESIRAALGRTRNGS